MGMLKRLSSVNLSIWVIVGALAGILCGVIFGEIAAELEPVGSIYVMLLQMCVFPYVISSLLHGLGSLTPTMAIRLLRSAAPVFVLAWGTMLLVLWMLSQAIPEARPPVVVRPSDGGGIGQLLSLVIPSNPFSDLSKNYVPAIVVFCVFYGIAIQSVQEKQGLLDVLDVFRRASVKIWGWVVRIAPFGVFALFADLAGTVQLELIGSLFIYLFLFVAASIVVALWILPSLLCALIPVRYPDLMKDLQEALVVAVVTSLPITAVPLIIRVTVRMVEQNRVEDDERGDIISTTLAVSYPMGQMGNLFVIFFMVFAAFYANSALPASAWISLPVVAILSTVGTPVSTVDAVAFMEQWLRMPSNIKLLYVELMTLTRYPQVLVSTMSLAFITVLIAFSYYRLLQFSGRKIAVNVVTSVVLIGGLAMAGRLAAPYLTEKHADPYLYFTLRDGVTNGVNATVHKQESGPDRLGTHPGAGNKTMDRVRLSRTLRVGYGPATIPFSYFNQQGDLVGHDVALAYALARDLSVDIEFYPITDWQDLNTALKENRLDLAIGGIYVTDKRLQETMVSKTYLDSPLALIVRAQSAKDYLDLSNIADDKNLKIAVFRSDILEPVARKLFPSAKIEIVQNYDSLTGDVDFNITLWTLEQAKAWAEVNPGFSAVVPDDLGAPLSVAFLMPPNSESFNRYLDDWLELQQTNGFRADIADYWLKGNPRVSKTQRWSVMHNMLGR